MQIKRDGDLVLLCCGRGRCPSIKKAKGVDNSYELSDDHGGKVILTKDQFLVIRDAIKKIRWHLN